MAKFKYQAPDKNEVRSRQTQSGGGYDSIFKERFPRFVPKEGDHFVRFLPATWEKAQHYGYDIHVHYGIGADQATYLCPETMNEGRCPICEEMRKASKAGNEEYAKDLRPKKRVLTWVIDRNEEKEGPKLWDQPWTVDRDINIHRTNKKTGEILLLDHPEEGYDIELTRRGAGRNTNYVVSIDRDSAPISEDEDVQDQWIDFVVNNPLPEILNFYDYDHLRKVFSGVVPESEDAVTDDDDDEVATSEGPSLESEDQEDDSEDQDISSRLRGNVNRRKRMSA